MRRSVAVLLLVAVAAFSSYAAVPPAAEFDLGMRAFRAGDYASAVVDLQSAATGFQGDAQRMASYQTALVYLALAHFRLGNEDAARDTILRLVEAEQTARTYATLPLDTDAADFETLVAALVPNAGLPRNTVVAAAAPEATPRAATPVETTTTITTTTTTTDVPASATAVAATTEVRVEEVQVNTDRRIAEIQAEADRRVEAARTEADRRIAAIQAEADRRIAAAEEQARQRVAAAEEAARVRIAAAEEAAARAADARIAAIEQETRERIAAMTPPPAITAPATTPSTATTPAPTAPVEPLRATITPAEPWRTTTTAATALTALRQADAYATSGDFEAAHDQYVRIASDPNAGREALSESAVGLYRIGSYRESAAAFRRLGVFARGEEDLRYYFAVALYETGDYRAAQKELACALPFIEVTDEVARYRMKIEQALAVTLTRTPTLP